MLDNEAQTTSLRNDLQDHPVSNDPSAPNRLAGNKLGVASIAFFAVAAAAPIAAMVGASPVVFSAIGPAAPLAYVIAALLIAVFAAGYLRMSRHIANAGGLVAYIASGLGSRWATAGAGIATVTYLALQVGLWSQFGVFAESLVRDFIGISLPPLFWVVIALAGVTMLTMRGVDASLKFLGVLIGAEILIVATLVVALIGQNGMSVFSFRGFTAENIFSPGLGVALLFSILCFTAVESTAVFSEEARDPHRTIPRALYLVIAFVGLFYGLTTWVIGGSVGAEAVQEAATNDPSGFVFAIAGASLGQWFNILLQVVVVTSMGAMLLGVNNMFSRYLFALGRAGALPKQLGLVSKRGTPARASLVNSALVMAITVVLLATGADPIVVVFAWGTALGTAGFMSILILTSIAVISYFVRQRLVDNVWATIVAPTISVIAFSYVAWLTVDNFTLLSGSGDAAWLLLTIPAAVALGYARGTVGRGIDYSRTNF